MSKILKKKTETKYGFSKIKKIMTNLESDYASLSSFSTNEDRRKPVFRRHHL